MQTRLYGVLDGVDVIAPTDELTEVHEAYVAMASAGVATEAHREVFMRAGMMTRAHGCQSILLAGTDLALVFGRGVEPGFGILDCAEAHAVAIASAALSSQDVT